MYTLGGEIDGTRYNKKRRDELHRWSVVTGVEDITDDAAIGLTLAGLIDALNAK